MEIGPAWHSPAWSECGVEHPAEWAASRLSAHGEKEGANVRCHTELLLLLSFYLKVFCLRLGTTQAVHKAPTSAR